MDDALNVWMLQRSSLAAAPWKWSHRREIVTVSNYKECLSLYVLMSYQTRPTDRCHPRLITRCGCNCPTINSRSHADRLGSVYSLEWFSKSWSVTDAVLIRRLIQRACSLLNDTTAATTARPTDPSHVASGPPLPSPVDLLGLQPRLPTRALVAIKWIRVSTVVKQSSVQLFIALP